MDPIDVLLQGENSEEAIDEHFKKLVMAMEAGSHNESRVADGTSEFLDL